jgi:hypothetical protein
MFGTKLLKNFTFKYKIRLQGKQGFTDTEEFEAIVKAESFSEAKRKLEKKLLSNFKISVLFTYPVEERRL